MKDQGQDGAKIFDENLRYQLKFLDFAPILHISAATGERTPKLLETIEKVADGAQHARADRRAESLHREDHQRASAGHVLASATSA